MALTSINLNETNDLEFSVSVRGATSNNAKTRFCVITEDKEIAFTGTVDNGTVKFNIPALEKFLEAGVYECKLEIMVDEYFFTPINETIEFKMPVSVSEATVISQSIKKEIPSVTIESIRVVESAIPVNTTKAIPTSSVTSKTVLEAISNIVKTNKKGTVKFVNGELQIEPRIAQKLMTVKESLGPIKLDNFKKLVTNKSTFLKLVNLGTKGN